MLNNIMKLKNDLCTGCGICEVICPQNAIRIQLNEEGFYLPNLNENKCINCGLCIKTCAKYDEEIKNDNHLEVYAFKNKNKEILKKSSSGGVSYEIMKFCLKNGYKIFGATYDYEQNRTISVVENNEKNLYKFFGSKYMQSYTVEGLKEVLNDKSNQKYAVFGTPCQIYGLKKYSQIYKKEELFLFVDLFCHGCPSLNLWKKYLEMKKVKYKCKNFDEIEFRSKINGWHEYSFLFVTKNQKYKTNRRKNFFNELFFNNDILNKSCYLCKYRSSLKNTDIRLGDFWGTQYDMDKEGVSAVVVCKEKGKEIIDSIKTQFMYKEYKLKEVLPFQSYGKNYHEILKKRKETLQLLNSDLNLKEIIKIYRKDYSLKRRIKIFLKKIIKLLPQTIYFKIKYLKNNVFNTLKR